MNGDSGHLAAVVNIDFRSGGEMLAWAVRLRESLRVLELLLIGARVEVVAGLSHQRWRVLRGEMPPRLRAYRVCLHLTLAIHCVHFAMLGVDRFKGALLGNFIEPARAAAREGAAE
jgi:hypothetical protein